MVFPKEVQWWSNRLFPVSDDILDIIKENYWNIVHKKRVLEYMKDEWSKRRPYKKLYEMCRPGVHVGRVFLKDKRVSPLIDGIASANLYSRRDNYYINGFLLEECIFQPDIIGRYGMEVPSKALFNIIDPITGRLIRRPSKEERIMIIKYFIKYVGVTIKYG